MWPGRNWVKDKRRLDRYLRQPAPTENEVTVACNANFHRCSSASIGMSNVATSAVEIWRQEAGGLE
jgi:hypothetical protein